MYVPNDDIGLTVKQDRTFQFYWNWPCPRPDWVVTQWDKIRTCFSWVAKSIDLISFDWNN